MKINYKHDCGNGKTQPEEFGISNARAEEMARFLSHKAETIKGNCFGDLMEPLFEDAKSIEECIFYTIILGHFKDFQEEERSKRKGQTKESPLSEALGKMSRDELKEVSNLVGSLEHIPGKGYGVKIESLEDLEKVKKLMKLKELAK